MTSSVAAVQDYNTPMSHVFTEADWPANLDLKVDPVRLNFICYNSTLKLCIASIPTPKHSPRKKVPKLSLSRPQDYTSFICLAWDYVEQLGDDEKFELITICPCWVLGPTLSGAVEEVGSNGALVSLCQNKWPLLPHVGWDCVDVRDVALAHILAMERSNANGRYIVGHRHLWMKDMATLANKAVPELNANTWGARQLTNGKTTRTEPSLFPSLQKLPRRLCMPLLWWRRESTSNGSNVT